MKGRGTETWSHALGLLATACFLASAILLIISSALTIADTRKGFAVTGLVSGTFIIAGGAVLLLAEWLQYRVYSMRNAMRNAKAGQAVMLYSSLPIIAAGIVYTIGYARKVPDPGSRGASIIATIGPAILLYALFLRLIMSQMARGVKPTAGRFWRMLGIDLYNLGAVMFVLTNAVYIVGTRDSLIYGGTFGVVAGSILSAASLAMGLGLLWELLYIVRNKNPS